MTADHVSRRATCNGVDLEYTLAREDLPLRQPFGNDMGTVSAFSYVVEQRGETAGHRPVVFLTNGGPGVASHYLHLSGIGPFRARIPNDPAFTDSHLYGVDDSPTSILDIADLVFLDAPGTGFGQIDANTEISEFRSVEGDAAAFAAIIAEWVTRHNRWNSPRFFLGESYGTQRAAFLATDEYAIETVPLNGLILLGQAVNIQETLDRPGNVMGALANLPYKAATAWYHGRGSLTYDAVEDAVRAALEFAWNDLGTTMLRGRECSDTRLRACAERLSAMIGIPTTDLIRSRLWLSKKDFRERLLDNAHRELGGTDSRYTTPRADKALGEPSHDATDLALSHRYVAAFHEWHSSCFGVTVPQCYRTVDPSAGRDWTWEDAGSASFVSMGRPSPFHTYPYAARLSRWMNETPDSRLFIGTGMYDSLTTIGAADHLTRHWDLPSERVASHWYPAGHMMYSDAEVAEQLNADLRRFLAAHIA